MGHGGGAGHHGSGAVLVTVAVGGGGLLSTIMKQLFDRDRPDVVPHLVAVTSPSFPSGHSMLAAIPYLTLGALLARFAARRLRRPRLGPDLARSPVSAGARRRGEARPGLKLPGKEAPPARQEPLDWVKSTKTTGREDEKQSAGQAELTKKGEELAEKLDDLLDEIDEVLEENAEEFVKGYIQRGGE